MLQLWTMIDGGGGHERLKIPLGVRRCEYMLTIQLDTTNTTVEQRMIANAVFGALSEA